MLNPCSTLPGWGSLAFGMGAWGGGTGGSDTLLPSYAPFDVFQLGPCGSFLTVTLYQEVTVFGAGQWFYVSETGGLQMQAGVDPARTLNVGLEVRTGIPDVFTAQWVVTLQTLPSDFADIGSVVQLGCCSTQGKCAGIMLSQLGMAHMPQPGSFSGATALPGSADFVKEGQTYVLKLVAASDALYVYWTTQADYLVNGHRLRYVLPAIDTVNVTGDLAWAYVRGVAAHPVSVQLVSFGVSAKVLISDFPPVADAGADQAISFCSILQLDASASYDPEGKGLTYKWRLVDAPDQSGFAVEGLLGSTYPLAVPTGYTDKWHSSQLGSLAVGEILEGDVLLVDGVPYDVLALGEDDKGEFIQITHSVLPDQGLPHIAKVLRQFGISGATKVKPTFYPDVPGFFRFDLQVSDGVNTSSLSTVVASVSVSSQARGVVPDMRFVWEYLSDFWRLVDDKQRFTVLWSGLAQFCAAELLNLWQYEYSKSLRDVQRTFQRRWLDYSLRYLPTPSTCTLRPLFEAYDSEPFATSASGLEGHTVSVLVEGVRFAVVFSPPSSGSLSVAQIVKAFQATLPSFFKVTAYSTAGSSQTRIRLTASRPFEVVASTSSVFGTSGSPGNMRGSTGKSLGGGTRYQVECSLTGMGLVENDFLEVDGLLYRILCLQSSSQGVDDIIVLKDALPDTASSYWSVPTYFLCEGASFYAQLVSEGDDVVLDIRNKAGSGDYYQAQVVGVSAADGRVLAVGPQRFSAFISGGSYTINVASVYRRTYIPVSPLTVDVPTLQEVITDCPQEKVLQRNLDYFLESYRSTTCIRFDPSIWVTEKDGTLVVDDYPPAFLWAEVTFLDNRPAIQNNFGIAAGFTLQDHAQLTEDVDYLSAVRGLWYSYTSGPKINLMRVGAQTLLGLPLAEEAGTIEELRTDFSPSTGRILIRDAATPTLVRSYTFPRALGVETSPDTGLPYAVGDSVQQFAPLVKGVELVDYLSDPSWIGAYATAGSSSVLQRFFRFLVRVDASAFSLAAATFVRDFILRIKPTGTYPILSMLVDTGHQSVDVTDTRTYQEVLSIFDATCGTMHAPMYDQPEDGGDGDGIIWKNGRDTSSWGHDIPSPGQSLTIRMYATFSAPTYPMRDSIFAYDTPVYKVGSSTPIDWAFDTLLDAGTYYSEQQV